MKKIKKVFRSLLTLVMSFCMISNVSAATTGSITVNGTTNGKTYEIYKIFDLTYSGTKVAYTIDSDWSAFFTGVGSEYIVDTNSGSLNQITIGDEIKYINITDSNIEEFTKKALTYATTLTGNDGSKVADGESLSFTNLDLGYYLVYPQGATEVLDEYGSICSITSTTPTATVNVKAGYPVIDKEVNRYSFDVGEYAEFKITGKVPDTTGYTSYTYIISDTWTDGLELDIEKVLFTVTIGDNPITDVTPVYNQNNKGFTLTFDMTKYQEGEYQVGDLIVVTYNLKITEDAINSSNTKNSATLTYSNDPKDLTKTTTTPPVEERVYSSKIEVLKVDGEDTEVLLSGAKFVLQNSEGKYYAAILSDDSKLLEVLWKDTLEEATVFTTNENGVLTYNEVLIGFEGLMDGDYKLIETEAPEGYNKIPKPIDVTVAGTEDENENKVPVVTSLTVENNHGTSLPSTGGIGTTLFIIIGSLLLVSSVVLLIANKRIKEEY